MKAFITGGSGFIGAQIITELLSRSHTVVALARSDSSAQKIKALAKDSSSTIEIVKGDLEDTDILKATASRSDIDGVIHAGFIHDFANLAESGRVDLAAVKAFGEALKGTNKPLISTAGNLIGSNGQTVTENDGPSHDSLAIYRIGTEEATLALARSGVRGISIRLSPTVHGHNDWAFIPFVIAQAKKNGVSAYVYRSDGSGKSIRWNAIHVKDAARLYVLALEKAPAGSVLHGAVEQEVSFDEIAKVIGKKLGVQVKGLTKEEAEGHFEWLALFASHDQPVTNSITKEKTGWEPKEVTLLEDLETGDYFDKYQ